jgi:hypothetical protein
VRDRKNSRVLKIAIVVQLCLLAALAGLVFKADILLPVMAEHSDIMTRIEALFRLRTNLLVKGNVKLLDSYYDKESIGGSWSLEKERTRIEYMRDWLKERNVDLVKTDVMFTRAEQDVSRDRAELSVCAHTLLTYRHLDYPESPEATMGWRTVHWLELVKKEGQWIVIAEWFLDPLENASEWPTVAKNSASLKAPPEKLPQQMEPWRQGAVKYADRYAGVKIGLGTGRYNQAYRDYSGVGGDCANFVSQVLTDKEGGNLPSDWGWFYRSGEGTVTWLKAEALVNHLLGTDRALRLARGTLSQVCSPTSDYPLGAIRQLSPGDIIAYEQDGEIVHVSLVVGFDPAGYVLVNSHSADRYRVPWDLGYNADVVYQLLKVQS